MRILISGIGIAGPAAAYWLGRGGHDVTLVERAPALRTGGYVIDFWGTGYTVAERMGLRDAVHAAGYAVREVRIVGERGQKIGGFSAEVFWRMLDGRFTSLPRGELAALLYRAMEGRAEALFGESIVALDERADGVRVRFEHAPPRDVDLVIGADGLHSNVRRLVFGPDEPFEHDLGYRVAVFEAAGYRPREELAYIAHTQPGRQIARFALRGDRTMFLFIYEARRQEAEPADMAGQKRALRHVFGGDGWETPQILAALDRTESLYFDRVSQIRMPRWAQGRVMLLGDAAACVSLLAGEGTGLALTEAYVLAGELQRSGGDHVAAFARCEALLRPLLEEKQRGAERFATTFAPPTAFRTWLRNQGTKLLGMPWVADRLVGRAVRDEFELPAYEM